MKKTRKTSTPVSKNHLCRHSQRECPPEGRVCLPLMPNRRELQAKTHVSPQATIPNWKAEVHQKGRHHGHQLMYVRNATYVCRPYASTHLRVSCYSLYCALSEPKNNIKNTRRRNFTHFPFTPLPAATTVLI